MTDWIRNNQTHFMFEFACVYRVDCPQYMRPERETIITSHRQTSERAIFIH